jgi:hypothetical protein
MSPAIYSIHALPTKEKGVVAWQVCLCHDGGRGPHEPVGPKWPTPREVANHRQRLENRKYVSPLRAE